MTPAHNIGLAALLLVLTAAGCAAPKPDTPDGGHTTLDPSRVPVAPVPLTGAFLCTAYLEGGLPAITWQRIPFTQEGNRLTGLHAFKDSFVRQDSVFFNGALSGGGARVIVTAVRADGSSNFTADLTGTPTAMTGQMMFGTSHRAVRLCSLSLTAAR